MAIPNFACTSGRFANKVGNNAKIKVNSKSKTDLESMFESK
jgi:hypothetical protein